MKFINQSLLLSFFPGFAFTVLQECATDSEELIYPMRAPSSCSAPPDLLLTGDREPIIGSRITPATNNIQQKDSSKLSTQAKTVDGIATERMLLEVSSIYSIIMKFEQNEKLNRSRVEAIQKS